MSEKRTKSSSFDTRGTSGGSPPPHPFESTRPTVRHTTAGLFDEGALATKSEAIEVRPSLFKAINSDDLTVTLTFHAAGSSGTFFIFLGTPAAIPVAIPPLNYVLGINLATLTIPITLPLATFQQIQVSGSLLGIPSGSTIAIQGAELGPLGGSFTNAAVIVVP